jgi:hypothetical protein
MGNLVNMAVFLIIALCILMPVVSLFESGGAFSEGIFPEITVPVTGDSDEYYKNLMKETEEKLKSVETEIINRNFKLNEDELGVEFNGSIKSGSYVLEMIELEIYTFKALSKRDEVKTYLENKYECMVEVRENVV